MFLDGKWQRADGKIIRISTMDDEHLQNTINMLSKRLLEYPANVFFMIKRDEMKSEQIKRWGKRKMFQTIEKLKQFNADSMSLDEMVELSATGRVLENEYKELKAAVPPILSNGLKTLRASISLRVKDEMEKNLKKLEAQLETLQTAEEKRAKIAEQIADLRRSMES